jgi:hypothetical protein
MDGTTTNINFHSNPKISTPIYIHTVMYMAASSGRDRCCSIIVVIFATMGNMPLVGPALFIPIAVGPCCSVMTEPDVVCMLLMLLFILRTGEGIQGFFSYSLLCVPLLLRKSTQRLTVDLSSSSLYERKNTVFALYSFVSEQQRRRRRQPGRW